jgi:hypothetical protein
MMGVNANAFIHLFGKYLLSSASEIGDIIDAGANAKADDSPAFEELTVLKNFFSFK